MLAGVTFDESGICGVYVDRKGVVHLALHTDDGGRREVTAELTPFAWATAVPPGTEGEARELEGDDPFRYLLDFPSAGALRSAVKEAEGIGFENLRPIEAQFLMRNRLRMFRDLNFADLRRCQLDIETATTEGYGFPSPRRKEDRILAIGLRFNTVDEPILLELEEMTDEAERQLLKRLNEALRKHDPDVIEGHNIFNFDLDFLHTRCRRFDVPCAWGRFGENVRFRKSRLRVAERWIDFNRFDIPGRTVLDTYLAIQLFDLTTRDLISYSLKDVAIHLGVTPVGGGDRTYLAGDRIQHVYRDDREAFRRYLVDDLRETAGVAEVLLPTYVAQAKNFPTTLQEILLRGTASKVDLVLLEEYYHANRSLPNYPEVRGFEGGYTRSFESGVFRHVLHYDVASLYPSLLLLIGRNPVNDSLGIFIPLLTRLREERLRYKDLARTAATAEMRQEYGARQASFKILINSFYGYLGFAGGRFADSELAAEVTRRGRELLQELIRRFGEEAATVLEADTDGIYVSSQADWEDPEGLLARVSADLPDGIDLEYDGCYEAMFCYGAKNYALYDGEKVTIRGSALRSRGIEPFLKELTNTLIHFLLGAGEESPLDLAERMRQEIRTGEMPVARLAKSEYLSQSPAAYQKKIEGGGKPRRASLEVALSLEPTPKMGDRVSYFVLPREKGQTTAWQRARALQQYDPITAPYDTKYYIKKIGDWEKRYGTFLHQDG